jgi:hypothetical protein
MCPTSLNETELALQTQGVVRIDHAIPTELLESYRKQLPALLERIEEKWCKGIVNGDEAANFIDVDLAWCPPLQAFAKRIDARLFGRRYCSTHRLTDARLRLVAPSPLGYLNWHVDHEDGPGLFLKALIYLEDVALGEGDMAYIPGSHREARVGDEESLAKRLGYWRFPGRAGSAVLFDTAGIHAPSANGGPEARKTLILSFARW